MDDMLVAGGKGDLTYTADFNAHKGIAETC